MQTADLPIGVFDSGLGGLTIVRALKNTLPQESLIYFGDTAHLPYGDKSPALIRGYCEKIALFLKETPVKAIVIACNTASAVALAAVKQVAGDVPVYDVVFPAAKYALSISKTGVIGIIATKTTVNSHIYRQLLTENATISIEIKEKATPLLVPMIEEGWLHNRLSQEVIDAYMSDTSFEEIDTLILGCTHYPLIKAQIQYYFERNERNVFVVDSSLAVAEHVKSQLAQNNLLHLQPKKQADLFYLSDFSQHFQDTAQLFLGEDIEFEQKML